MTAPQTSALRGELERARVALYDAFVGGAPWPVRRNLLERVARLRARCLAAGIAL